MRIFLGLTLLVFLFVGGGCKEDYGTEGGNPSSPNGQLQNSVDKFIEGLCAKRLSCLTADTLCHSEILVQTEMTNELRLNPRSGSLRELRENADYAKMQLICKTARRRLRI